MLINQVRGMNKSLGRRLPACAADAFARKVSAVMGQDMFPGMAVVVETIAELTGHISDLDRQLKELGETRYPAVARLQQVPGVGPITALYYVLTVEDPARFASSRTVGAYLGLCPRQHSSGDQQPQMRITKCGDGLMRGYLVQAAHYMLGPFGPDSDLRQHGLRLCERGGKNAKKRAVVAVARKLAVLLHHLWKTGEDYQPLIKAERAARQAA